MGDNMTNKEAIEIVNNLIRLNKEEFYPDELEAFDILLKNTQVIETLNEIGNVGYIISAEDMKKVLERR